HRESANDRRANGYADGYDRVGLSSSCFPWIGSGNRSENRARKPDRIRNIRCMADLSFRSVNLQRRVPMGATADKVKGTTNEAIGKAKQGGGEATGSDRLQGEGVIQEVKGKGQKAVGDAKQATKDAVNNAAAAANKNLGATLSEGARDWPSGRSLFV